MGHGTVADEIKGRAAQSSGDRSGAILKIEEQGVRFRSYLDGSTKFMGPETSMEVQAALGSDIALVFDECTPFHGGRDYTARSTERTHRWLDRCLEWHARERAGAAGRLRHRAGRRRGGPAALVGAGGRRPRHRRRRHRRHARRGQGRRCSRSSAGRSTRSRSRSRAHLLGIGEVDDLVRGIQLGIDTFDCAMPTRIGRHGMALVPDPEHRWRVDLAKARGGCPRSRCSTAAPAPPARPATRAATCTTCSGARSTPRCGCSRSTTSPTCSG